MENRFAEMDCFVLAGGKSNATEDFEPIGDLTRLEKGYRQYAAVFEKVRLVLKKEQATERYLNYPHVCDTRSEVSPMVGLQTALEQADSEAVFIGSSEIVDFPLELAVELVKSYDGEMFLGYYDASKPGNRQPLFGIFSKKLISHLSGVGSRSVELSEILEQQGKLIPLPVSPDNLADQLGLA
jgi:molybdopterin-guanine dinucleotide biosynthesis protein A